MLRRFQDFQWGPLNATRLNELVDSITRLQQQVAQFVPTRERGKDMILARIKDDGTRLNGNDTGIKTKAYGFAEVGMSILPDGAVGPQSYVEYAEIPGGVSSDTGSVLLALDQSSGLTVGQVVIAHHAPMIVAHSDSTKRVVYTVRESSGSDVVVCEVVGGSGSGYKCDVKGTGERIIVENLYETAGYYGALDEQPECAALSPLGIPDGSRIWAFKYGGLWYTMTPTAFSVSCTCNDDTTPEGMMRVQQALEAKAAAAMLDIQRGLI